MIDDDLQELVDFRNAISSPDEETTRRVYARVTQRQHARRSRSAPLKRPRSRRLVIAFAAAVVLVPPAVAFAGRLADLFQGAPPTPAVATFYQRLNRTADEAVKNGLTARLPQADVSKIHGVIQVETADGPVELWTAPNADGGQCSFVDFADDAATASGQPGNGTCDTATPPASRVAVMGFWVRAHPSLVTVYGRVYADASTVEITLADSSMITLPVAEGFFLGSLGHGASVSAVTAYDAAGNQTATWVKP